MTHYMPVVPYNGNEDALPVVPYNGNEDAFFADQFLNLDNNVNMIPPPENPAPTQNPLPPLISQSNNAFNNTNDLNTTNDQMMWSVFAEANHFFNGDEGPSNSHSHPSNGVQGINQRMEDGGPSEFLGQGIPLAVWPPPPSPYNCSCCQVLREFIHADGNWTTKLEIHGRLGIICHCILETHSVQMHGSNPQYNMLDLTNKSMEDVKNFLKQYCEEKKKSNYMLIPDPLTLFYETICVGLDCEGDLSIDDYIIDSPMNSGDDDMDQLEDEPETSERPRKTNLSQQRKRTRGMTLNDLRPYFHMPMLAAAKMLNMCPTVVKKICRRGGMARWPHRKIKSILKQIQFYSRLLDSENPKERESADFRIKDLQRQLQEICSGVNR